MPLYVLLSDTIRIKLVKQGTRDQLPGSCGQFSGRLLWPFTGETPCVPERGKVEAGVMRAEAFHYI